MQFAHNGYYKGSSPFGLIYIDLIKKKTSYTTVINYK